MRSEKVRSLISAGVGASLLVSLVACGAKKVSVELPTPDAATTQLCHQLVDSLPATIASQSRREISDNQRLTAAWGEPPLTLRCGVGRPTGFTPESSLIAINGIDWFAEQLSAGYRFTTTNTNMYIEVVVPHTYSPEANALTDLSAALSAFK
jgi:hypothetical protein